MCRAGSIDEYPRAAGLNMLLEQRVESHVTLGAWSTCVATAHASRTRLAACLTCRLPPGEAGSQGQQGAASGVDPG